MQETEVGGRRKLGRLGVRVRDRGWEVIRETQGQLVIRRPHPTPGPSGPRPTEITHMGVGRRSFWVREFNYYL